MGEFNVTTILNFIDILLLRKISAFYYKLGNSDLENRDFVTAIQKYKKSLFINPYQFKSYVNQGVAYHQLEEPENALRCFNSALSVNPLCAEAYVCLGNLSKDLHDENSALLNYDKAIQVNASFVDAYVNKGILCKSIGDFESALNLFNQAINLNNNDADLYIIRAALFYDMNEPDKQVLDYDQALSIRVDPDILCRRADALCLLNRPAEALSDYSRAIELKVDYAEAYNNRGNLLSSLNRHAEAVTDYGNAIKFDSAFFEAYSNRGNVLFKLGNIAEAILDYNKAISINPNLADAYYNRANLWLKTKQPEKAAQDYDTVLRLNPDYPFAKGFLLHAKMLCCAWEGVSELYNNIVDDVAHSKKSADPFGYIGICSDEASLKKCAEIYSSTKFPSRNEDTYFNKITTRSKIKIGYLCGEFREQATAILMSEIWELHNKNDMEVFAFDNGFDDGSERRSRIKKAFDHFFEIQHQSDTEVVALIRSLHIDILVNLNGYFGLGRQGVFAARAAPIQVNYLGFPGTLGADYMDYIVVDKTVIPPNHVNFYTEKVVYLPHTYQPNDSKRLISKSRFTRQQFNIPDDAFVFCCFNNPYKITPNIFTVWMGILKNIERGVIWFIESNSTTITNLRSQAEANGIKSERLIFSDLIALPDHLARCQLADLFLDTLPYNAHTTASDALWAGLPILTCMGNAFAGRVAASLLLAIDLPELITTSLAEYEQRAIELAKNPQLLNEIKMKLAKNKHSSALFNSAQYTQHLENAYKSMYWAYNAGIQPNHIDVS